MSTANYYMIGAKPDAKYFQVLEIVSNEAASLEAMAAYANLGYRGIARRIATAAEFARWSMGGEVEFCQL